MSGISRLLVLATAFFALAASPLHAVPTSYLGGTSWVAGSWSGLGPGNFPDSPLLDVLVDGPLGADFTVAVDFTAPTAHEFQTNSLTLGVGDVLNFTNGRRISTFNSGAGPAVINDGTMNFNTGGLADTGLLFRNSGALTGTGEVVMFSLQAGNAILADGTVITHAAEHTIRGQGRLLNNTGGMENFGTILAQAFTPTRNVLTVDPDGNGFVNHGTFAADAGGVLELTDGVFTNNGVVDAMDAGVVRLLGDAQVSGGTLRATGTGLFEALDAPGGLMPELNEVAIADGTLVRVQQSDVLVTGSLLNDGVVRLSGASSFVVDSDDRNVMLSGHGEIRLTDNGTLLPGESSAAHFGKVRGEAGILLHQGASHTIRGSGDLLDDTIGMVNDGRIVGATDGRVLRIDPDDILGFVNNGEVRATGSNGISLVGGVFDNNTVMSADDGSMLQVASGARVLGGELTTTGTGMIDLTDEVGVGAMPELVKATITAGSNATMRSGADVQVIDGLLLDGTLTLQTNTRLFFDGATELGGSGQLLLENTSSSDVRLANSGDTLSLNGDVTVAGAGNWLDGTGNGINHGTIQANVNVSGFTRHLTIDPGAGGSFANFGELTADNSGTLRLRNGEFVNRAAGSVTIASDGFLELDAGATLRNEGLVEGRGVVDVRDGTYVAGGGRVSPGQSPGTLTWLGDFDQGGVDDLLIEIAGTTQGTEYDFLDIQGGNAILDGTLTIDLLGFLPLATDVFEILRVDAGQLLSGRFSSVRTLGGGNFDVVTRSAASGTSIVLTNFMAPLAVPTPAPALLLLSLLAFLRRAKLCPVIPGR